jgi:hypothetical protein
MKSAEFSPPTVLMPRMGTPRRGARASGGAALRRAISYFRAAAVAVGLVMLAAAPAAAAPSAEERRIEAELKRAQRAAEIESRRQESRERAEQRKAERDQQRDAAAEKREQKLADKEAWCETFHAWAINHDDVPPEVVQARFSGGLRLAPEVARIRTEAWALQDDRARRLLGKTFEELSEEDFADLSRRGGCRFGPATAQSRPMVSADLFSRAQHPQFKAEMTRDLALIRKARADAKAAESELGTLAPDSAGLRRYEALVSAEATLRPMLAEAQRGALSVALDVASTRVLVPALAERARSAMAGASGLDGLASLTKVKRELTDRRAKGGGGADTLAAVVADVNKSLQRLATEVAASERRSLDALGNGAAALERGVQWHREYEQRIAPHTGELAELRALPGEFQERRARALQAARGELSTQISRSASPAELEQVVGRYLPLASDAQSPAGAELMAKVEQRRELFERNRVLGRAPTDTSRPAATSSNRGEPTVEDIYEAVNAQFRGVNANAAAAAESCNSGGARNDALLAMQCLGMAGAAGVGQGGTFRPVAFKLTRLQKVGCAPAVGQAGYMCDYVAGFEGNTQLPPSMDALVRNGSVGQARFIRVGDAWQMLPANRDR